MRPDGLISFGDDPLNPGIQIEGVVHTPLGGAGKIGFVQLGDVSEVTDDDTWTSNGHYILDDGQYHDRVFYDNPIGVLSDTIGGATLDDTPGTEPGTFMTSIARADYYMAYLMYQPDSPGSIWITIGRLDWFWTYSATRSTWVSNWTMIGSNSSISPTGEASVQLPEWTNRIGSI